MVLWQFPDRTRVGRTIPKSTLYAQSRISAGLKALFVEQVGHIIWEYKLAPETLNLPEQPGMLEIQVLSIELRTAELDSSILRYIDQVIPLPTLFELRRDNQRRWVACYKQRVEGSKPLLSDYFAGDWVVEDAPRTGLPVVLNLVQLYERLLQELIPLPARSGETLPALIERALQVRDKQREIRQITSRLNKEKQFNRKVEINSVLQQLQKELETLTS
jgi:hypothetical protein